MQVDLEFKTLNTGNDMTHTRMRSHVIAANSGRETPIPLADATKNLAILPDQALSDINKCVAEGSLKIIRHHGTNCLIAAQNNAILLPSIERY